MRLVVMTHRIPDLRPPEWEWDRDTWVWTAWPEENAWYVLQRSPNHRCWIARASRFPDCYGYPYPVAAISTHADLVTMWWTRGVPAILTDDDDLDCLSALVEAVHPYITTFHQSLLPTVGFRAYCTRKLDGSRVPWWKWSPSTRASCDLGHAAPDYDCLCGFHAADDPWALADEYFRPYYDEPRRILVVAPWGRVIQHEFGARAQRYDVVACVAPLEAQLAPEEEGDPRLIRARNLPLRAWEVAHELAAAARLELSRCEGR